MDISKIDPIEDFDYVLAEKLLLRWNSSRRSHPAMKEEMRAVAEAEENHSWRGHNADFEVCHNLTCRLAVMLEQAYGWINDDKASYDEGRQ